jgi:hypothetical protein
LDPAAAREGGGACDDVAACGEVSDGWACVQSVCRRSSRWLFVATANSGLRFNGGAILAFDLDAFFAAFEDRRRVLPVGASVTPDQPCRSLAGEPQVAECTEEGFARPDAAVHLGNFLTVLRPWFDAETGRTLLLTAVRGDPSIAWIEVDATRDDVAMSCGEGEDSDDAKRCSREHLLRFLRDDEDLAALAREPFNIVVSESGGRALAWVAHSEASALSLVSLTGLDGGERRPVLVDRESVFSALQDLPGGFGLAVRPCDPADAPAATEVCDGGTCEACRLPLVYAGFRYSRLINRVTARSIDPASLDPASGRRCVGPDDLGTVGGVICDPQVDLLARFFAGGLVGASDRQPELAGLAFSDGGDELYAVQSSPGALLRLDSTLDEQGVPRDLPSGAEELCSRPTSLTLYEDGGHRFALASCYTNGQIFVVDLDAFRTVSIVSVGAGPNDMVVDLARQVVYVANTLEGSISVIDMAPERVTRFSEIARLGLQEPYST